MNFYALFNCIIRVKMFRIINISYISDEKMQKISCKKREKSVKKLIIIQSVYLKL